ncbi:MAG TPA: hypothetical protein DD434_15020, partial [Bacteroidales bacterium]|nr:hypothetical protein [Bacteroidales bacterium]
MKTSFKYFFIVLVCFVYIPFSINAQDKRPESITQREYPQWFKDAKLGIFIHFGLYSVPSWSGKEQYAEWFYKGLISGDSARIDFQKRVFGENFKYEDYKDLFKAELFDADAWATLFKRSGAKYVIFTTKHHDGYCMWNSKYAKNWNSMETAPKRDFCQELSDEVRKKGMEMGFYYSLTEWTNPLYRWTVDTNKSIEEYAQKHLIPQFKELVDKYKPTLIFSDGDWDHSYKELHSDELVDYYYKVVGEKAIVNDRFGKGFNHGFLTPEYSAGIIESNRPWAECRGIGRSFGLNRNEDLSSYKTSEEIIQHFVQLVAGGGGLTLNVGPGADGQIPLLQQERLLDLGKWLSQNGDAIYGSKPYKKPYDESMVSVPGLIDSVINFDWVRNSPFKIISEDNFNVTWFGIIKPKFSEKYTISCKADDYALVYLNSKLIIDTKKNINSCEVELNKGEDYKIYVEYVEKNLEASISLKWKSKSQEEEPIKAKWKSEYKCSKPYVCYTTKNNDLYAIAFSIPEDNLILKLDKAPKDDMTIYFLDKIKYPVIPWTYKDGKLIINT